MYYISAGGEKMYKRVILCLDEETDEMLTKFAKLEKTSRSQYARKLIMEQEKRIQKQTCAAKSD